MIVVDTSALLAVLLEETQAGSCSAVLTEATGLVISAGTLTEALLVAGQRGFEHEMEQLIEEFGFEIAPVTLAIARRAARAYSRWGKGNHPAKLNFGDCFAYAEAEARSCPLLFIGEDFKQTDLKSALNG